MDTVEICKHHGGPENKDGYWNINPKNNNGHKTFHRKLYSDYHQYEFEPGEVVRHRCDNTWCIEITHLILGDQADNVRDSVERGRHKNPSFPGSTNPMALLTEKHIKKIRMLFKSGKWSHKELAEEFEVDRITILNIVNEQTWKHVE